MTCLIDRCDQELTKPCGESPDWKLSRWRHQSGPPHTELARAPRSGGEILNGVTVHKADAELTEIRHFPPRSNRVVTNIEIKDISGNTVPTPRVRIGLLTFLEMHFPPASNDWLLHKVSTTPTRETPV